MPGGGEAERATGRRARAAVRLAAVAALSAGLLAAPAGSARAQAPDLEAQFVARIAAERQAAGRGALAVAADLVEVARRHSATMASENRLYHNTQLGTQVVNWLKVGENVGTGATVESIHGALMASPTHRDEILGPSFTQVGVGVVRSDAAVWVTQIFRLPEQTTAVTAPAATAPAAPAPTTPVTTAPPETAPPTAPPTPPPSVVLTSASARSAPPKPRARSVPATAPAVMAPPTAPPSTTAPAAPLTSAVAVPLVLAASPPRAVDLAPVSVVSSEALPLHSRVSGVGAFAAGLLWLVAAAVVRSVPRRAFGRR